MSSLRVLAGGVTVFALACSAPAQQAPAVAHGGPIGNPPASSLITTDCVSPADRAWGEAAIRAYQAQRGPASRSRPLYDIVPMGGTLYSDLLPPGYVDHDPTAGRLDYSCHDFMNDGHRGTDIGLHSFDEQAIGVPIFAAQDGIVVATHDGEPDMNLCICGQQGNQVIIDHGGDRFAWYFHMKNGSVAVSVGQPVVAGRQIGLVASSGSSAGPHLHFETRDDPGQVVFDPFAGACGGAVSGWTKQPEMLLDTYIPDFGYSTENLSPQWGYPFRYTTTGQMGFDEYLWFWARIVNLPPHSQWRQEYIRPDGTVAFDSGYVLFESNQTAFYRNSQWWWYTYYVFEMRTIPGTWRIRLSINGAEAVTAPIEVKPVRQPGFNRAPEPISAVFDPPRPNSDDVVFCRVNGPLPIDDLDYDLVRFRYVWRINGVTVRDIVSAGRADALPRGAPAPGDTLSCTITPSDGVLNGTPATATVGWGLCPADINGDGFVDGLDSDAFNNDFEAGNMAADYNGDGFVDGLDSDAFNNDFEAGC